MPFHHEFHRAHLGGWLRAAVLGANDGIVSIASLVLGVAAARLALLRDARLVEIAGAGHMMHWTHPAELASAVVDFLA